MTRLKCCIRMRFVLCFMIFLGFLNLSALRNSISVALVTMKDKEVIPENIWNLPSESVVLMSYYPTIIITNVLSGFLGSRFSGKMLSGLGILLSALLSLFLPLAAEHGYFWLIVIRTLQGLFQGFVASSFCSMYGKWFPISERAVLKSICSCGMDMGMMLGNPITGYLCASNFLGGWPAAFYLFGIIAIVWYILWWLIIYECPKEHPWISEKELKYILESQGDEYARKIVAVPWSSILRSSAVWSLIVNGMSIAFFAEFIRLIYPTYLSTVFNFNITKIGWLTTMPHVLDIVFSFIGGGLGDFLVSRNALSRRTLIRKIIHTVASISLVCCLIGVTLSKDNVSVVVALNTVGFGLHALNAGGSAVGVVEISPVFSGAIAGLRNAFTNIVFLIAPLIIGAITANNESSPDKWNIVFYIAAATAFAGALAYLIFGSADLQPWGLGTSNLILTSASSFQDLSYVLDTGRQMDLSHPTLKLDKTNSKTREVRHESGIVHDDLQRVHYSSVYM